MNPGSRRGCHPRAATLTALLVLALALVAPGPREDGVGLPAAVASSVTGGALNPPGENSHNVAIGWPEVFYVWEGLVKKRSAYGVRVGVQLWPLGASLCVYFRLSAYAHGRLAIAFLASPSLNFAGFGGTRATYLANFGFGRSRSLRPSLGPGLNLGWLGSIDVSPRLHVLLTFEVPFALWIWTNPVGWWIEMPILGSAGLEYDVSYSASIFGRIGGGPAIAFTGLQQLLGVHWHLFVGAQFRY